MSTDRVRRRFRVRGIVQGVGFRPFVYGLSDRWGLAGFVLNDGFGVLIEVEGAPRDVECFHSCLLNEQPPLAVVSSIEAHDVALTHESHFVIRPSDSHGFSRASISPDIATCDDCLAEITDPEARRFRYAFTNCTNCGPRFTITNSVPYDRPNTTMVSFEMCERCRVEYGSPMDRRFHAQPIACPECGPHLMLIGAEGTPMDGDPLVVAAQMIRSGEIIAAKGLGGFHLVCDASDDEAVRELRARKGREEKPLAVMVPDVDMARKIAHLQRAEESILLSNRRPIVLVRRRSVGLLAPSVAPNNRSVGLMLPYTPLHHLLLEEIDRPVVMTSGNLSDEPIAYTDADAMERLAPIAAGLLTHDRDIRMRCDDSVVRVVDGEVYPIRRSRGLVPEPLEVAAHFAVPVLAVGGQLKHTFCLGIDDRAILSHHIGDLESFEAMVAFEDAAAHFLRVFDVYPKAIAHDLHPDYLSTKWALQHEHARAIGVQHHHAHIAACLADNGRSDRVIGLALDGTGYGDDGTLWGCEVLICDLVSYERVAHLRPVPLPGGTAAVKEPWRMAVVYLLAACGDDAYDVNLDLVTRTSGRWGTIVKMADAGINSPSASSAGRLFDAVAALCGLRDHCSYEGQAAAELEQVADPGSRRSYGVHLDAELIDGAGMIAAVVDDLVGGAPLPEVAAAFHNSIAETLVAAATRARDSSGVNVVALSGGSFQNLLLLERTRAGLTDAGFEVLVHRRVPPNDGGLSLGQAVVANARAGLG